MYLNLLIIVLSLVLIYFFLIYCVNGGFNRKNQPTILRGNIPYLGAALEFGKNPTEFVKVNQQKHGNIFTIYMLGRTIHFVLDPVSVTKIYKHSKVFGMDKISMEAAKKVAAVPDELFSLGWSEKTATLLRKHLQASDLDDMSQKYFETSKKHLLETFHAKDWKKEDFYQMVRVLVYKASSISFFGDKFDWKNTMDDFFEFDANFAFVAFSGLPDFLFPKEIQARNRVMKSIDSMDVEDYSAVFKNFKKYYFPEFISNFAIFILVASQANTGNASFWTVSNILKDLKLKALIEKEIEEKFDEKNIRDSLKRMDLLDSCIKETLRMNSFPIVLREIVSDFNLEVDGKSFLLKKGEEIILSATENAEKNFYENRNEFKQDRFLDKNGKSSLDPLFSMFGGGARICPGMNLAKNQLMIIVIAILKYCDCKLDEVPIEDFSKVGVLAPINKVPLNIKLK
jgi:cytochrome P450